MACSLRVRNNAPQIRRIETQRLTTTRTIRSILLAGGRGEKTESGWFPELSFGNEHHPGLEKPSEINADEY